MIYKKTPLIELKSKLFDKADISLFVKREDLNHPHISGNKWWKLKYNVERAVQDGHTTLLTFGGAYSNHLYATAAVANETGLKSIGVVRGEETLPLNPTLTFVKSKGMQLHFTNRENYKKKNDAEFIQSLARDFGNFYLIPEGGTNELAVKGCEEWAHQLDEELSFDYLCLPVGTGGTMSGMVNVLSEKKIVGFSSLKGGAFLNDEIRRWVNHNINNWRVETNYHFGGYAKVTKELSEFIAAFEAEHNIPLDPVYTAKMMFGIFDLINKKTFERGSKILALHTGGLQGRSGVNS